MLRNIWEDRINITGGFLSCFISSLMPERCYEGEAWLAADFWRQVGFAVLIPG
jgi:hypothetical protein